MSSYGAPPGLFITASEENAKDFLSLPSEASEMTSKTCHLRANAGNIRVPLLLYSPSAAVIYPMNFANLSSLGIHRLRGLL